METFSKRLPRVQKEALNFKGWLEDTTAASITGSGTLSSDIAVFSRPVGGLIRRQKKKNTKKN